MAEAITIARPYAVAIFKLAKENKALTQWSDELALIAAVVADATVSAMIDDPKLSSAQLESALLSIFKGKLSDSATNFVKLLVENNRLPIVADIVAAYETLKDQDQGVLEAELTAAVKPADAQVQTLVKQLEAKFGKKNRGTSKSGSRFNWRHQDYRWRYRDRCFCCRSAEVNGICT